VCCLRQQVVRGWSGSADGRTPVARSALTGFARAGHRARVTDPAPRGFARPRRPRDSGYHTTTSSAAPPIGGGSAGSRSRAAALSASRRHGAARYGSGGAGDRSGAQRIVDVRSFGGAPRCARPVGTACRGAGRCDADELTASSKVPRSGRRRGAPRARTMHRCSDHAIGVGAREHTDDTEGNVLQAKQRWADLKRRRELGCRRCFGAVTSRRDRHGLFPASVARAFTRERCDRLVNDGAGVIQQSNVRMKKQESVHRCPLERSSQLGIMSKHPPAVAHTSRG
jgi:hypothetical protein